MRNNISLYKVSLNRILDLLYLSNSGYNQLKSNVESSENRTLFENIAERRAKLAAELETTMAKNDIKIDKRAWSSTSHAFPPRSEEIDAKGQFESIDKQLLKEYDHVVLFSECTVEVNELFDNHRSNILTDLKELSNRAIVLN